MRLKDQPRAAFHPVLFAANSRRRLFGRPDAESRRDIPDRQSCLTDPANTAHVWSRREQFDAQ